MVGGRYHCFMVRPFDFIGTTALLYGRTFDFHRNGIYAILSEGKNKIIINTSTVETHHFVFSEAHNLRSSIPLTQN